MFRSDCLKAWESGDFVSSGITRSPTLLAYSVPPEPDSFAERTQLSAKSDRHETWHRRRLASHRRAHAAGEGRSADQRPLCAGLLRPARRLARPSGNYDRSAGVLCTTGTLKDDAGNTLGSHPRSLPPTAAWQGIHADRARHSIRRSPARRRWSTAVDRSSAPTRTAPATSSALAERANRTRAPII